jgi:hypothetical protein
MKSCKCVLVVLVIIAFNAVATFFITNSITEIETKVYKDEYGDICVKVDKGPLNRTYRYDPSQRINDTLDCFVKQGNKVLKARVQYYAWFELPEDKEKLISLNKYLVESKRDIQEVMKKDLSTVIKYNMMQLAPTEYLSNKHLTMAKIRQTYNDGFYNDVGQIDLTLFAIENIEYDYHQTLKN